MIRIEHLNLAFAQARSTPFTTLLAAVPSQASSKFFVKNVQHDSRPQLRRLPSPPNVKRDIPTIDRSNISVSVTKIALLPCLSHDMISTGSKVFLVPRASTMQISLHEFRIKACTSFDRVLIGCVESSGKGLGKRRDRYVRSADKASIHR